MERRRPLVGALVSAACLLAGAAPLAEGQDDTQPRSVSVERLQRHIQVLAADELEGRGTGTRGGDLAARYLAGALERLGWRPLGGDGYQQLVPMHASTPTAASRLTLTTARAEDHPLELSEDYVLFTGGDQTLVPEPAELVLVGYGIVAPEFDHNDYQDHDVTGKIVVFLAGEPPSEDPEFFQGAEPTVYSSSEIKQRTAISRGAVGSVLLPPPRDVRHPSWAAWQREFGFEHVTLAYSVPRHLSLVLRPAVADELLLEPLGTSTVDLYAAAQDHRLRSRSLDAALEFRGEFTERDFLAANIVALWPGRDPELRDSYVVLSAHYDHLGVGPPMRGDPIYNGVVDNALGVAGVLEIARVLAEEQRPLRRSVIVLLTTGEEKGLLGSSYFVDHPPVPLARIVANVNVDGLAFFDDFEDVIGIGGELSTLGSTLGDVTRHLDLEVGSVPPFFWVSEALKLSDQYAFAQAGVPAILISEGFTTTNRRRSEAVAYSIRWGMERYHTPFDDLEQRLDLRAAAKHTEVILTFVQAVANSPMAPRWYRGTPYRYQRLLTLAEAR
jgi:hypothetical protein